MAVNGYLREAADADMKLLFEWANDPMTRRQSFSQKPITWEEHEAWFRRLQADEDRRQYILMASGAENEAAAAGALRLEKERERQGVCRISYSIAPDLRGKGYGTFLLSLADKWAAALVMDAKELCGEVRAENAASICCFEKNGFARVTETRDEQSIRFVKKINRENLIYFRADANAQIGFGHMMRCLTVADACQRKGLQPVFVTADGEGAQIAEKRGFPSLILHGDYRHTEPEPEKLPRLLMPQSTLVLDSYYITADYVKALKEEGFSTAWMDDYGQEDHPADVRINYNLYAKKKRYAEAAGGEAPSGAYLTGPSYAPVRPAFCAQKPRIGETVRTVLVTTGAGDPCGAGAFFAKELAKLFEKARILTVCGPYADTRELSALSEKCGRIRVITGLGDLSGIMHESDLAVSAAGSTLYELCAAAVPTVTYYFADNQKQGAEAFAKLAGSVCLGDLRDAKEREMMPLRLREAMRRLADRHERETLAETMHGLVDGKGAERIAGELAKLVFRKDP